MGTTLRANEEALGEGAASEGSERRVPEPYRASKSRSVAGVLAILFGAFGIHKFYLGYFGVGFTMMAVTVFGSLFTLGFAGLVMSAIGVAEGVVYLATGCDDFQQRYVAGSRPWF